MKSKPENSQSESKQVQETQTDQSKPKYRFWVELVSLIKKKISKKEIKEPQTKIEESPKFKSPDNNSYSYGSKKVKKNSIENFVMKTDDKTYNKVTSLGSSLLYAIKGETPPTQERHTSHLNKGK